MADPTTQTREVHGLSHAETLSFEERLALRAAISERRRFETENPRCEECDTRFKRGKQEFQRFCSVKCRARAGWRRHVAGLDGEDEA